MKVFGISLHNKNLRRGSRDVVKSEKVDEGAFGSYKNRRGVGGEGEDLKSEEDVKRERMMRVRKSTARIIHKEIEKRLKEAFLKDLHWMIYSPESGLEEEIIGGALNDNSQFSLCYDDDEREYLTEVRVETGKVTLVLPLQYNDNSVINITPSYWGGIITDLGNINEGVLKRLGMVNKVLEEEGLEGYDVEIKYVLGKNRKTGGNISDEYASMCYELSHYDSFKKIVEWFIEGGFRIITRVLYVTNWFHAKDGEKSVHMSAEDVRDMMKYVEVKDFIKLSNSFSDEKKVELYNVFKQMGNVLGRRGIGEDEGNVNESVFGSYKGVGGVKDKEERMKKVRKDTAKTVFREIERKLKDAMVEDMHWILEAPESDFVDFVMRQNNVSKGLAGFTPDVKKEEMEDMTSVKWDGDKGLEVGVPVRYNAIMNMMTLTRRVWKSVMNDLEATKIGIIHRLKRFKEVMAECGLDYEEFKVDIKFILVDSTSAGSGGVYDGVYYGVSSYERFKDIVNYFVEGGFFVRTKMLYVTNLGNGSAPIIISEEQVDELKKYIEVLENIKVINIYDPDEKKYLMRVFGRLGHVWGTVDEKTLRMLDEGSVFGNYKNGKVLNKEERMEKVKRETVKTIYNSLSDRLKKALVKDLEWMIDSASSDLENYHAGKSDFGGDPTQTGFRNRCFYIPYTEGDIEEYSNVVYDAATGKLRLVVPLEYHSFMSSADFTKRTWPYMLKDLIYFSRFIKSHLRNFELAMKCEAFFDDEEGNNIDLENIEVKYVLVETQNPYCGISYGLPSYDIFKDIVGWFVEGGFKMVTTVLYIQNLPKAGQKVEITEAQVLDMKKYIEVMDYVDVIIDPAGDEADNAHRNKLRKVFTKMAKVYNYTELGDDEVNEAFSPFNKYNAGRISKEERMKDVRERTSKIAIGAIENNIKGAFVKDLVGLGGYFFSGLLMPSFDVERFELVLRQDKEEIEKLARVKLNGNKVMLGIPVTSHPNKVVLSFYNYSLNEMADNMKMITALYMNRYIDSENSKIVEICDDHFGGRDKYKLDIKFVFDESDKGPSRYMMSEYDVGVYDQLKRWFKKWFFNDGECFYVEVSRLSMKLDCIDINDHFTLGDAEDFGTHIRTVKPVEVRVSDRYPWIHGFKEMIDNKLLLNNKLDSVL